MAEKQLKATAKLFVDTKDARSDARQFFADLKKYMTDFEKDANKLKVFQDFGEYISTIDKNLSALKDKNPDLFEQISRGLDDRSRKSIDDTLGYAKNIIDEVGVLSDKLSQIQDLRTMLDSTINEIAQYKKSGKIEGIAKTREEAEKLLETYEKLHKEVNNPMADKKSLEYQQKYVEYLRASARLAASSFDPSYGRDYQISDDKKRDFEESATNAFSYVSKINKRTSNSINTMLDKIVANIEMQISNMRLDPDMINIAEFNDTDGLASNYNELNAKLKEYYGLKKKIATVRQDSAEYDDILNRQREIQDEIYYMSELDDEAQDEFYDLFDKIDESNFSYDDAIKQFCSILEVEMPQSAKHGFEQVGKHAIDTTEYIQGMTAQLRSMFDVLSQPMDVEYKVLINGQDINVKKGIEDRVPVQTIAEAYLSNIDRDAIVSAHSHQGGGPGLNALDLGNMIQDFYSGTAKLGATIGGDSINTWNLAGVAIEDAMKAMKEIERYGEDLNPEKINEIFKAINPSYTNVAKRWKPDDFEGLAKYIYEIGQQSEAALTPVERFQNVLKYFVKGIDLSEYKDLFTDFKEENAGYLFNQIMSMEGVDIQVDNVMKGSLSDITKEIQKQKDAMAELRAEAEITYSDIEKFVKEYNVSRTRKGDKSGEDFLKTYFHASERQSIEQMFTDVAFGERDLTGVTRALASYFDIDLDDLPDTEFQQIGDAAQDAKNKMTSFLELASEISRKSFTNPFSGLTDDVEIGKYTERIEVLKAELDALGEQGKLTADDLQLINLSFDSTKDHLRRQESRYTGYGDGVGDYTNSEYRALKNRTDAAEDRIAELESDLRFSDEALSETLGEKHALEEENENLRNQIGKLQSGDDKNGKVESFLELSREIQKKDFWDNFDARDNVIIGEYTERLNKAKGELDALGEQGKLTASQIDAVNDAFEKANLHLYEKTKTYDGYGSGYGMGDYAYTYEDEYNEASEENTSLKVKIDELQQENNDLRNQIVNQDERDNDANLEGSLSKEALRLEVLQQKLIDVRDAVDAKTRAFEEEYVTVDAAVDAETASLNRLLDVLNTITTQIGNVIIALNNVDVDVIKQGLADAARDMLTNAEKIQKTEITPKDLEEMPQKIDDLINAFVKAFSKMDDLDDIKLGANIDDAYTKVLKNIRDGTFKTVDECVSKFRELTFVGEMDDLSQLNSELVTIKKAVDNKTEAFRNEAVEVGNAVATELTALTKLKKLLEEIQGILQTVFDVSKGNFGDIEISQGKENVDKVSSAIQNIQRTLNQILGVLQGFTGIESDGKNSIKHKEPVVDNKAESKKEDNYAAEKLGDLATEKTLRSVRGFLKDIKANTKDNKNSEIDNMQNVVDSLVDAITANIKSLKDVTDNVVQYKKDEDERRTKKNVDAKTQMRTANDLIGKETNSASVKILANGDQAITTAQQVGAEVAKIVKKTNDDVTSTTVTMSNAYKVAMEKTKKQIEEFNSNQYFGIESQNGNSTRAQTLYANYLDTYNQLQLKTEEYGRVLRSGGDTTNIQQEINILQTSLSGLEEQLISIANKSKNFLNDGNLIAYLDDDEIKSSADNLKKLVMSAESLAVAFRGVSKDGKRVTYDVLDNGSIKSYAVELDDATGIVKKMTLSEHDLVNSMQKVNEAAKKGQELNNLLSVSGGINKNASVFKNYKQKKQDLDKFVEDVWSKAKNNGGFIDEGDLNIIDGMAQEVIRLGNVIQSEYSKVLKLRNSGGVFDSLGTFKGDTEDKMRSYLHDYAYKDSKSLISTNYDPVAKTMTAELVDLSGNVTKVQAKYNELFDGIQVTSQKGVKSIEKTTAQINELKTSLGDVAEFIDNNSQLAINYNAALNTLSSITEKLNNGTLSFNDDNIKWWNQARAAVIKHGEALLKVANDSKSALASDKTKQTGVFNQYKKDIKDAEYVTDEMKDDLQALENLLRNINSAADLTEWINQFEQLQKKISNAKNAYVANNNAKGEQKVHSNVQLDLFDTESKKLKNALKLNPLDTSDVAKNFIKTYDDLISKIKEYRDRREALTDEELEGLRQIFVQLKNNADAYTKQHPDDKDTYSSGVMNSATNKYNHLFEKVDGSGLLQNSKVLDDAMKRYKASLENLRNKHEAFNANPIQENEDAFKRASAECNTFGREIDNLLKKYNKLHNNQNQIGGATLSGFVDTKENRIKALTNYVETNYKSSTVKIEGFKNACRELIYTIDNGDGTFTKAKASIDNLGTAIVETAGDTKKALGKFESYFSGVGEKFRSISQYLVSMFGFQEMIQQLRLGIGYVKEIDSALTELKKVTNETDSVYDNFLKSTAKAARVVGSTVSELTTMAADWARLGYNIEEAGKLAESTAILLNVSEFEDATSASEALISTMQAFQYTAEDSQHVVDILNEVGNNYAVSSDGIAVALQDSASALMEAGNNLEQSVALVAAANKVVQDPNSVGSALRTISLRLRGTSVEVLEELGEETDGAVESVSKMQKELKALTGVDILTDSGAYKDTYTILKDIAKVWEDMDSMDQAAALELMAGKNRANTLAAILNNVEDLENAYESALNSEGSAMRENDAYLESIQGHIDIFTNSLQTMWMNFISTDAVKWFVHLGDTLIRVVDKVGLLKTAITGVLIYFNASKKSKLDFASMLGLHDIDNGWLPKIKQQAIEAADASSTLLSVLKQIETIPLQQVGTDAEMGKKIDALNEKFKDGQESLAQYVSGLDDTDIALKAYIASVDDGNYSLAGFQNFIQQHNTNLKASSASAKAAAIGHQILNAALSMGITILIGGLISGITKLVNAEKEAAEAAKNAASASKELGEQEKTLNEYKDQIKSLRKELDSNTLSESDAYDAREKLIGIQNELIDKFGLEKDGINLVTGAVKEQIEAIDKLSQKNAQQWLYDNQESINNAIEFFSNPDGGTYLDGLGTQSTITNWGSSQNVSDMIKEYADSNDHTSTFELLEIGQDISFSGSADDVKAAVEDFQEWLDGKEIEMQSKLVDLTSIPESERTDDIKNEIESLKEDIEQLQDVREDIGDEYTNWFGEDSTYATNKAVLEEVQRNKAITTYADQYMKILDAENSLIEAQVSGDSNAIKTAIDNLNSATADAADAAKNNGEDYMVSYFSGISDAYDTLSTTTNFELDLLDTETGLKNNISSLLSELDGMNAKEILQLKDADPDNSAFIGLNNIATEYGITIKNLINILAKFGYVQSDFVKSVQSDVLPIKTYSELVADIEGYNDVLSQTSEIVADNTEVTQEYKDSLIEMGISEKELAECFDENNGLIVKNAKKLNDLVKSSNKNVAANVKLAKSQARLDYYNLYKQMYQLSQGSGKLTGATLSEVNALYAQMNAIEKTIYKYSLLEAQLLGATNAFAEFEKAQNIDSETDYIGSVEGMIEALGTAFNTAELGSETAQAAIAGLVPESVYADLDTVDKKMDAIYKYFKEGKLSMYFDVQFDEDGKIESVEMKLGNLRKFIEDGLANGAFVGDDWQHFDLSEDIKTLDDLAEKMKVTKEVALAFVKSLEDHDIEWLNGDYTTLFDKLITDSSTIQALKKQMQEAFSDANVDLTMRPQVSWEKMDKAHWDVPEGSYSTVNTVTYMASDFGLSDKDGNDYAINVTPILPNGDVIDNGEDGTGLYDYIMGKINSGESIEDLDIFLGAYKTVEEACAAAELLHKYQEDYYSALKSYSLENDIYKNVSSLADLEYQLANGKITVEDYTEKMHGLNGLWQSGKIKQDEYTAALKDLDDQLENGKITADEYNLALYGISSESEVLAETARDEAVAWHEKTEKLNEYKSRLEDYYEQLEAGKDSEGNIIDTDQVQQDINEVSDEINKLVVELSLLEEPTDVVLQFAIDDIAKDLSKITDKIGEVIEGTHYQFDVEAGEYQVILDKNDPNYQDIMDYVDLLNEQYTLSLHMGAETTTVTDQLQNIADILDEIAQILSKAYNINVETGNALSAVQTFKSIWDSIKSKSITLTAISKLYNTVSGLFNADGTAHASGSAHASGDWGLPQDEYNSLVGELGPEMVVDPRSGRYYTVGDRGAEMVDLPKGAIIFNHKQTESLLKNGYVTSRGKAYAEGNAHVTIYPTGSSKDQWKGTGYSGPDDPTWSAAEALSSASDSISNAADEFKEVFDWIEIRLEEINEDLNLKSAQLENKVGYSAQNKTVDEMIALNKKLYDNLTAAASYYDTYASKLLPKVNSKYRDLAKNGAINIDTFKGEIGEKQLEAIQEYREWVQKGADATQQAEETLTEISALAKQAIDNISQNYENKNSLRENRKDQLEAYNALTETTEGFESEKIYKQLIKENNKIIENLQAQKEKMQAELNEQVEAGNIKKYSQDWYDAVNDIAAVDTEIIELTTDTNEYQDTINELYWDKFDALISRIEAVSDEADNLIDILSNKDLVDEDGNWTDEGVTSLGLYAQQMEVAEVQAKKYQEEIAYLNKNWKKLGYTEEEYIERLNELKDGQYDSIQAYHDAKDAIVDLNKERVDAIKEGIQKEIDAYEELIAKKKEALDTEKDLYDFQKNIMEQEKDVADLKRQLAALSGDDSASARAKRAQLEAELAEANANLEEAYYERSIQNQQNALDKELENFQDTKETEMEGWDEYLENTEQVVSDSLTTIQANTDVVYQTLSAMGEEYSLSITESLTSPWKEGEYAIQSFSEQFGISMSATVDELKDLELQFKEIMAEIEQAGKTAVSTVSDNANKYTEAEKKATTSSSSSSSSSSSNKSSSSSSSSTKKSSTAGLVSGISGNIKYGDKGSKVKNLQKALNALGYGNSGTSSVDGIFGSKTLSAVKKFQKAMGISADGIVGTNTKKKFKLKGYAVGSTGVDRDQLALIDELGEELVMHADGNGRLAFLSKGSAVVPHNISENIMELGQLDPQSILDANRPQIGVHPEIHNTEINLSITYGDMVSIGEYNGNNLVDLEKMVAKQFDKHTKDLNNALRKYTR